ncbi:MAG: 2-oxoglutarate oxidoreductase, gamma subunit (EC [uncultured Campylobacterales bacterium]|uniref:2-oxoglutarate oxidoreductase, gamma subunit (EC) n=1 Tax=uncultured Campylobacterales bacterium TaxID=352960 RepID=A0A6S6T9L4_9BACT|nr:MAG: 2-oxoglutarate oxidoreductase, gamma subunit (EC [uncultured Campylobacterales bacterium]
MRRELRFTGAGGQGVLTAGAILAQAKINDGGFSIKASTYSSQVRGGPTKVDILLDESEILFPYAIDGQIEFMLSTAQQSFNMYKSELAPNAIIVVDSHLVEVSDEDRAKYTVYDVPIIYTAKNVVGNVVTQSVVALAITVELTKVLSNEVVYETMVNSVPPKSVEVNKKAYDVGVEIAKKLLAK